MIIDTQSKTVQIQGESIGQVVKKLQEMLPDAWEEYQLLPQTITVKEYINYPYIIPYQPYIPNPWSDLPIITYCDNIPNTLCGTDSNINYPLAKDSGGDYIYGDLAGKPIKHCAAPDVNAIPTFRA